MGSLVAILGGIAMATHTSLFHAREVEVHGASRFSPARIAALAQVDGHTNVPWLNEGAIERRLEANPWIADARVGISFPLTIAISVTERVPVAVAFDGSHRSLVASDGTTLEPAPQTSDRLPLIQLPTEGGLGGASSSPAGAARAIGAMSLRLRATVDRVQVLPDGRLEVWLDGGMRVNFGPPIAVGLKARAIDRALSWAKAEGERILVLSVIAPSAPAVELAPAT